jgi:CDP-diacylglycerol--glycerol-3-phosphate 3-phosphatidyltransferase
MLSLNFRPQIARVVDPAGRRLAGWGVSPDLVTVIGTLGVSGGALAFYPRGTFFWGTVFITCFVFSDMLDGAIARVSGRSGPWGAFLDSTLDRVGDAAVFGGLALWYAGRGDDLLLCAVALYDLVAGSLTSYIKARAEGVGLSCNVGFAERSERLITILVLTGLSGLFGADWLRVGALWLLAAAPFGAAIALLVGYHLVFGVAQVVFGVSQASLRQLVAPAALQARIYAPMRTVSVAAIPIGMTLGGLLAESFTPLTAVVAGAAVATLAPLSSALIPRDDPRLSPPSPET